MKILKILSPAILLAAVALAPNVALSQTRKALPQPRKSGAPEKPPIAKGILVKVEGNKLFINPSLNSNEEKPTVKVPTDNKTVFIVDYDAGKLSELKPGMKISVNSVPAGHDHPALTVVRAESPKCIQGTIVNIEGTNVIVNANQPLGQKPKEVTVATDGKTRVLLGQLGAGVYSPAKLGTLDDLAIGMLVRIFPDKGPAAKIWAAPTMGVTPGSSSALSR